MKKSRFLVYPLLLFVVALLIHAWVAYPLFWKNLPFRFQSYFIAFTQVKCDADAAADLAGLLKYHALPNFSHTAQVFHIDAEGKRRGCLVSPEGQQGSRYRLGSTTKAVTAHALLGLAKQGSLGLDDPLLNFFPEVNAENLSDVRIQQITLAQLLNHSSGIGGFMNSADTMERKGHTPWCPHNFQYMETIRLSGTPGSNHAYSNVAYCLLGEVIARASGMAYRDYIRKHYLSGYPELDFVDGEYLPDEPEYDVSNDYRLGKDYIQWLDFAALSSAAGLMGSPEDFARMVWQHFRPDVVQLLSGPQLDNCGGEVVRHCFSWNFELLLDEQGEVIAGVQQGYMPGVSSLLALTPDGQVLVWAAAGAPILGRHRDQLKTAVGRFFERKKR